jgi:Mg-chelatase subunit ChlI
MAIKNIQNINSEIREIILNKKEIFGEIIGQDLVKNQLKSGLISGRNIIIVGPPGTGKTTLVKSLSNALSEISVNDCGFNCTKDHPVCPRCKTKHSDVKEKKISGDDRFVRIQGSPDLTIEDLIGDIDPIKAMKFGALSVEAFNPGKIFRANGGILFFDEINRCNEKLQNAMLQLLQEHTVTIGSYSFDFEAEFIFIATMNPKDINTERLSDVFLDRFDLIYMNYPEDLEKEEKIVITRSLNDSGIKFPQDLLIPTLKFVRGLRTNRDLDKVPSVRASIGLYERSVANAIIRGSKSVDVNDILNSMESVLAHRISLKPSLRHDISPEEFLKNSFESFCEREGIGNKENRDEYT